MKTVLILIALSSLAHAAEPTKPSTQQSVEMDARTATAMSIALNDFYRHAALSGGLIIDVSGYRVSATANKTTASISIGPAPDQGTRGGVVVYEIALGDFRIINIERHK